MSADHNEKDPLKSYLAVFAALMALLALTLFAYTIPFENWNIPGTDIKMSFMNTVVALTIAFTKALMVVLVFMHLRHSTKLTWIIASAGFIWLGIMMAFTFADFLSRNAIPEGMKEPLPPAYSQVDVKIP
jgi:caa(3)-type oxidase subunit IV